MSKRFPWYEKLFFKLQLRELKYFRWVFGMVTILLIVQFLLTLPTFRKKMVLIENYEGQPIPIYKSLNGR